MAELDDLPFSQGSGPANLGAPVPRRCRRHVWVQVSGIGEDDRLVYRCRVCLGIRNEAVSRRGRQSRNYGNRAELAVARTYGGTKIGHAGGPVDVRGKDFDTQVKTHRRLPPVEWTKALNAMAAGNRCPRLLLRFVHSTGPTDYFVFRADDFLEWFGKDDEP